MNAIESEETPRIWLRFSDEPVWDADYHEQAQALALAEAERLERLHRQIYRWGVVAIAILGFLGFCTARGFSVGPGGGERTICEAAGGHMIDRVVAHRCADY